MPRLKAIHLLLSLATLSAPVLPAQNAISARPGTLNYVEGQASLEGHQLTSQSVGHTELAAGQFLATANGRAEVLLTPGVFLRLDNNTTVKMVSPSLTRTEVELTGGRASVEVDQLYKQNDILVDLNNQQTHLLKNGIYEFDAGNSTLRVFGGKAAVFSTLTPQTKENAIEVKGGKQLNAGSPKAASFDRNSAEASDQLYSWSSLRADYLGEANLTLASSYAREGYGGFAPGWFWSPSIYSYTWLPGSGLLWSPFGYGFYSPAYLYGGGFIYGGYYGGGYGYRGGSGVHFPLPRAAVAAHASAPAASFSHASGNAGSHGGGGGRR